MAIVAILQTSFCSSPVNKRLSGTVFLDERTACELQILGRKINICMSNQLTLKCYWSIVRSTCSRKREASGYIELFHAKPLL